MASGTISLTPSTHIAQIFACQFTVHTSTIERPDPQFPGHWNPNVQGLDPVNGFRGLMASDVLLGDGIKPSQHPFTNLQVKAICCLKFPQNASHSAYMLTLSLTSLSTPRRPAIITACLT
jgi:hypothetical protein